jgi:hypothetical protein
LFAFERAKFTSAIITTNSGDARFKPLLRSVRILAGREGRAMLLVEQSMIERFNQLHRLVNTTTIPRVRDLIGNHSLRGLGCCLFVCLFVCLWSSPRHARHRDGHAAAVTFRVTL